MRHTGPGTSTNTDYGELICNTLLGTGAFDQVDQARDRQTDRQVALKVVIVDGVLYSKRRKQKEQEGERGDWLDEGTAMNDGRSASPPAFSRRHLGQSNGSGLIETTAAALRGGEGDVCKWRLPMAGTVTKMSRAAELEVRNGGQVTTLPPPPHRY